MLVEDSGLDDASNKVKAELGLYGDSEEEIMREINETGAVPVAKMATKPITLLCHTGNVNMNAANTFKIDHQMCMDQADWSYKQGKFMPGIEKYLEHFKYTPEEILHAKFPTTQHKKIVGLIEVTVGVLRQCKQHNKFFPLFFECPEQMLHPSKQTCVASFLCHVQEEFK